MPPHIPLSHSLSFYWALDNLWLDMLPFIWPIFSYSCFLHIFFFLPSQLAIKVKRFKKKNTIKFHPALTFISSLLCAGGCICYCHSILRTGVYGKNTSPRFHFFPFFFLSMKSKISTSDPVWVAQLLTPSSHHLASITEVQKILGPFPTGIQVSSVLYSLNGGCWWAPLRFWPQSFQNSLVQREKPGWLLPGRYF